MRKNTKRSAVIAGVAAVVIGGGVAAWATGFWTVAGSGSAEANTAEIIPLTATSTLGGNLYPGASAKMTTLVTNANEFDVKLNGTVVPTDFTVTANTAVRGTSGGGTTTTGKNPDACKRDMIAKPSTLITATTFPGTPTIPANTNDHSVESNVTIGDLPQTCAGMKIVAKYTFDSTQLAPAKTGA